MSTQHTLGPWHAEPEYISAQRKGKTGNFIVRGHMDVYVTTVRGEEDARLIAAAPDLLAALQDLYRELHAHIRLDVRKHYSLLVADAAASKALFKARGKVQP